MAGVRASLIRWVLISKYKGKVNGLTVVGRKGKSPEQLTRKIQGNLGLATPSLWPVER